MRHTIIIYIFAAVVALVGCTSRPSYVLSGGDMEDVLYDMHRAHFLLEQTDGSRDDGAKQYALMQSVLRQHGVSAAVWDSSMVYYSRNADELEDIYKSLTERLSYEATVMGAGMAEGADSTDIWRGDKHILLLQNDISPSYQWTVEADTLLRPGEKLRLNFLALFLNEQSQRRATALIALRLKNDSVITRNQMASQTGIYTLEISDDEAVGIKSVSGLFMLHRPSMSSFGGPSERNGQSQILSICQLKLLHEPKAAPVKDDSISSTHPDTLSHPLPHAMKPLPGAPPPLTPITR